MKNSLLFLSAVLFGFSTFAQAITGDWYGMLNAGGQQLPLVLHIQKTESGYESTMDSPDQNANGIPVSKTLFQRDSLILNIKMISATYTGKFDLESQKFEGTFTQMGQKLPLDFSKKKEAKTKLKRPQRPKRPFPYYTEEVFFQNKQDSVTLAGTLTLPKQTGNFPAVVLINGSGPVNRDEEVYGHKLFLVIADYLTRHGIAVLRYDKRGAGKSTGNYDSATTADFANDAAAAFAYLHTRKAVDKAKVGLIGHSEGGTIAPIVAAKNKNVAFIVLLAGTGVNGGEVLLKQQELIGKATGKSEDYLKKNAEINGTTYKIIRHTKDTAELRKKLTVNFENALKKYPEVQKPKEMPNEKFIKLKLKTYMSPWMRYFISYDPKTALRNVSCPVLALDGTNDLQVNADQNLQAIKKALQHGGNSDITVKKLEDLNHLFQESETGSPENYGKIEQTFSPKALKIITNWILNRIR